MATVRLGSNRGVQTVGPPVRTRTGDAAQDAARQDLERDQKTATTCPLLGGVILDCVTPDTGTQLVVHHRLGRKPQGWFPMSPRDAIFDMYEAESPDPTLTLVLERGPYASVDARFKLYIF
ncbi:hypothetical protein K0U83_13765 [bacterium]|nr:hypothetical protein [bacterium]